MPQRSKWQSLPTEAINPATLAIDKQSASGIVDLMLAEDRKALAAVQRERDRIALGADMIAKALRRGGRVVFVGAGTSGRLGALESAEMPPTFGTDYELVQAVMAGGKGALLKAREGAEDNYEEGTRAVTRFAPTKKDVVIGVSASGMTPFVRGALTAARRAGARIIFVTCDPRTELQTFVDLTVAPAVGPEVIAGSTRLKAGTATKLVLNAMTTAAMVLIGKTYGNLMVDVRTGSEKLRDRARRIVQIVTGVDYDEADRLLVKARWNVKAAVVMQKTGLPYQKALGRIRRAKDLLRDAIGEDIEPRLREVLNAHAGPAPAASAVAGAPVATPPVATGDAAVSEPTPAATPAAATTPRPRRARR
jgi:N-acetylmuramic acid 6-phosphate etherase